jgi:hypothetical protein
LATEVLVYQPKRRAGGSAAIAGFRHKPSTSRHRAVECDLAFGLQPQPRRDH